MAQYSQVTLSDLPVAVLGKNIGALAPHHLGGNNGSAKLL